MAATVLRTPDRHPTLGTWTAYKVTDPDTTPTPTWDELTDAERLRWVNGDAKHPERGAELLPVMPRVYPRLAVWIAETFPGAHIKRTPSATSMALILRSLPWDKAAGHAHRYPTLAEPLERLIAGTTPMHRKELAAHPGARVLALRQFDARLAYASYMRELPVAPLTGVLMDTEPTYEPFRQGRYRVRVTVPEGWQGIGLVPRERPQALWKDGRGRWEWPNTPRETWEQWLDATEVALLSRDPKHGGNGLMDWPYTIRQRMLFAPQKSAGIDPLRDGWLPKLCAKIEAIDAAPNGDALPMRASRMAVRCMLLHPVGMWHRGFNQIEHEAGMEPEGFDVDDFGYREDGTPYVRGKAGLSEFQRRWHRVEWAAAIYARERVAVTRRALSLPLGTLAAIDADAVTVADYLPDGWADTGKVGAYRLKHERIWPYPGGILPQDVRSLNHLVEGEGAHHG